MKKTTKVFVSLALTLLTLMSLTVSAMAASISITFNGFSEGFELQPGSDYTDTDLFDNFKGLMPGDTATETVTFTNASSDCDFINLFLRAEAHDDETNPLTYSGSTENAASMSDFLAQLSMKVWNGSELIFDASPDELGGFVDNVLLGAFRSGEKATLTVEISVPLDLGNEYANRVGEVDWVFHVEGFNDGQISVRKVWSDGNINHAEDSVTVNLLKDGAVESSQILNASNGWAYTFDRLETGHVWTVEEAEVPEGYTVRYRTVGAMTTIINTPVGDSPEPPAVPLNISVKKEWSADEVRQLPESVSVTLYDGDTEYETVLLSEENGWSYSWKDLNVCGNWQVVETNIPKGYTPSYHVEDSTVTITNTRSLLETGQQTWPILLFALLGVCLIAAGIFLLRRRKNEA